MGSSPSKAARAATKISPTNTARKYPTRPPPAPSSRTNVQPGGGRSPDVRPGQAVRPDTRPSSSRDQAITVDASDPDLALNERMRQLGPVQLNNPFSPTQSSPDQPSSQFRASASNPAQTIYPNAKPNAAVSLLTARYRLAEEAEEEFAAIGRKGSQGRQFLDVVTIRQILMLRDETGMPAREIERKMGLKSGVVERLGKRGVVSAT